MEAHNGMHTMESTSTDCDQVGDCVDCKNDFRSLVDADVGHTRTDCNGGLPVGGLHRLECTSTDCDGDG